MKSRDTALAFVITLAAIAVWWFMQPKPAVAVLTTHAPSPQPKSASLIVAAPSPSQMPVVVTLTPTQPQPAPQPDTSVPTTDPQSDLKTAFPDIARLIRAGDMAAFLETYEMPNEWKSQDVQRRRDNKVTLARSIANIPSLKETIQRSNDGYAQTYEALADQTPTLNAAGDEATYMMTTTGSTAPYKVIFVKIDGEWYLKQDCAFHAGDSNEQSMSFGSKKN